MTDRYIELLRAIRDHLASVGDSRWPERLSEWLGEFETMRDDHAARRLHYERTRRALGGMGSIADVVIAGANDTLLCLVQDLDREVERLLAKDGR
jgi:hypothetical protein